VFATAAEVWLKGGSEQGGGRALILVVERDLHVQTLEKYFLEEAGFDVDLVGDGQAALERARTILPGIVISEILVPKLDGLSVCRALKADPRTRSIDVLIFSILAGAERAREAGADAFLRKPMNQSRLVDSVKELLRLRHDRRFATGSPA
jgi:DNA-binding response OmpR family regulator